MDELCLYRAARLAAEDYRRSVAGRNGGALADEAISEWNRLHWWFWICDRVVEHVRGEVFWRELDANRFAAYRHANGDFHAITDEIHALRRTLEDGPDRLAFDERELAESRLAELVNRLLD